MFSSFALRLNWCAQWNAAQPMRMPRRCLPMRALLCFINAKNALWNASQPMELHSSPVLFRVSFIHAKHSLRNASQSRGFRIRTPTLALKGTFNASALKKKKKQEKSRTPAISFDFQPLGRGGNMVQRHTPYLFRNNLATKGSTWTKRSEHNAFKSGWQITEQRYVRMYNRNNQRKGQLQFRFPTPLQAILLNFSYLLINT